MKLVITVDDCGVHPAVVRAAARLAAEGLATSACIVANGPDVEGAARLEGLDLGIGLDILRGKPVGHWQERATLVDERGMFLGSATRLFARYAAGDLKHEHVEAEWRAQIERVLDLGVRPTHISSHANVHAWPTLTRVAGDLAAHYGIGWMRTPDECAEVSRLDLSAYRMKFLNVCGMFSRSTPGVAWPGLAWGAPVERGGFTPARFAERVRNAADTLGPDAVIELCCRPGLTMAGDAPIDSVYDPTVISAVWQEQFASLSKSGWREVFAEQGLELVGFGELGLVGQ